VKCGNKFKQLGIINELPVGTNLQSMTRANSCHSGRSFCRAKNLLCMTGIPPSSEGYSYTVLYPEFRIFCCRKLAICDELTSKSFAS